MVGVYFLFRNSGSATSTKGDTIAQKWSSLFGTSKQKQINTVVDTGLNNIAPSIPPVKIDDNTNITPPQPGNTTPIVTPGLNPFPYTPNNSNGNYVYNPSYQSKLQCEDGLDNDGDGSIDKNDAGCHTDLDPKNPNSYDQWLDDESAENGPNVIVDKKTAGGCTPNRTIIFSDKIIPPKTISDKDRITQLINDFYRLAPNLATKEDIKIEEGNAQSYQQTIDKATEYTKECYDERKVNSPSASEAPKTIKRVEYADTKTQDGLVDPNKMWMTIPTGKYLLEVKKSPLFTSSTITPSASFLPGYQGVSFSKPFVDATKDFRFSLFKKYGDTIFIAEHVSKEPGNGGTPGKIVTAHVLQTMRDFGITRYYIPAGYTEGDDNYNKLLSILRREVNNYMNTLKPGREAWMNRSSGANGLSDFQDWADTSGGGCWDNWNQSINAVDCWDHGREYGGLRQTKEALDTYLKSGSSDEVREVDAGAQLYVIGQPNTSYDYKYQLPSLNTPTQATNPSLREPSGPRGSGGGTGTPQSKPRTSVGSDLPPLIDSLQSWASKQYEVKTKNQYQTFEESFNVW